MTGSPQCTNCSRKFSFDELAFWFYTAAVAFTALGPVAHYVLAPFALLFLAIGAVRKEAPFGIELDADSRRITLLFSVFTIWAIIPNWFNVRDFMTWGEGASVFLEALVYMLMGARIFNTDDRREKFAKVFVIFNGIFCLDVTIRMFFPRDFLVMNHTLQIVNTIGNYALLILPVFACWALWHQKNPIFKPLLPIAGLLTLITSYSSGYWASGAITALVLVYFAVKAHKITWKFIVATLVCAVLCVAAFVAVSGGAKVDDKKFADEFEQMMSIGNMTEFTNHRDSIWFSAYYLAMKHPIAGQGRDTFAAQSKAHRKEIEKAYGGKLFKGLKDRTIHPHNMYLTVMYAAGIPALLMFIAALAMMLRRATRCAINECINGSTMPWGVAILLLLISQILVGMVGDIFEARRDLGVIFWACLGMLLVLPTGDTRS